MALTYRRFTDGDGRRWEVWAVPATLGERRATERRRAAVPVSVERRSGADRRVVRQTRVRLTTDYRHGWLVFETEAERRRLTPVPAEWEELDEPHLAALCRRARQVR